MAQFLLANYAISSLFITFMRAAGAGALFLVVIAVRHRDAVREILIDAHAVRRLIVFGVLGLFGSQITYVMTIGYTNAGTATVLQSTNIVMVMLVTCLLARRIPRIREMMGLFLALAATLLISTQGDLGALHLPTPGLFWGFLSAAAAACYSMLPQPLYPRWGSFTVVGLGMAIDGAVAAAMWACAFAVPGIDAIASAGNPAGSALVPQLDFAGVAVMAAIVVFGTFGAFFLFLNGMSIIGAVQGSQLGAVEPVSATVCSALLMGTAFSVPDWLGLGMMVGTIMLVAGGQARMSI